MKIFNKKFLSTVLTAGTLLSGIPAFASIPADVSGTRFEEPVQILSSLDIMVGDENGDFRLDDTIIRSEVAKMAIHALGLEEVVAASKGEQVFDDVSVDHWANGYISLAVSQGIIEGDGDGNFRPNAPITYAEAMVIMVRATGYTIPAEENGGYPNGYIKTATSNGLTKNVEGSAYTEISRGNVAYLTVNALECKLMEQTSFGSSVNYTVTDKTLLTDKLNVTKNTGQITAIAKASLTGTSSLPDGRVKIDDVTYDTDCNISGLLGYNVTYYLKSKKGSNDTVILALPTKNQNKDLTISADLFSKVNDKVTNIAVEYYADENTSKTTTAQLSSDFTLIYNGKYQERDINLIDLADKSGYMTLLDYDKDGKYDIVSVKSYENIVVNTVSSTGKITDKYSSTTIKLDDSIDYTLTLGLEKIDYTELKEYDVLSLAASLDKELYEIELIRKQIEGKVTSKDSKGVLINGERYKIAANCTDTIEIGTSGTFCLDIDSKIAALKSNSKLSSSGYAYLTNAYYTKNTDTTTLVLLTPNGKEVSLETNNKVKLNSISGKTPSEIADALTETDKTVNQLITYSVNSNNKITNLNTAVDNTDTENIDTNTFTLNKIVTNSKFVKSTSKLDNVRIDNNTIIFDVSGDEEDYDVGDISFLEDGQYYDAYAYDMTENHTAQVLVITKSSAIAAVSAPIAVVKNISSASNSEDEKTDMLTVLTDGNEISLLAKSEGILVKNDEPLQEGDIIQYKTNSKDEIVSVRVLFDASDKTIEFKTEIDEKLETIYGKVTKKFTNSLNVKVNNSSTVNYIIPEDVTVYSVDTSKSKTSITVSEFNDIHIYDTDENNRIFIKIYDDEVTELVIVK